MCNGLTIDEISGVANSDYPVLNEVVTTNAEVKITACTPDSLSTHGGKFDRRRVRGAKFVYRSRPFNDTKKFGCDQF